MSLDDELRKVRARQQAAADQAASMGSTARGVFEASVRASLDHAIENIDPSLANLERALGEKIEPGAFLMGMMGAAFAIQGLDINWAIGLERELFVEYIEKARQR